MRADSRQFWAGTVGTEIMIESGIIEFTTDRARELLTEKFIWCCRHISLYPLWKWHLLCRSCCKRNSYTSYLGGYKVIVNKLRCQLIGVTGAWWLCLMGLPECQKSIGWEQVMSKKPRWSDSWAWYRPTEFPWRFSRIWQRIQIEIVLGATIPKRSRWWWNQRPQFGSQVCRRSIHRTSTSPCDRYQLQRWLKRRQCVSSDQNQLYQWSC